MAAKKHRRIDRVEPGIQQEYDYHLPVMLSECLEHLRIDPDGVYIDGTLGGGGHSAAILERLGELGRLHSFDADEVAIQHCSVRFAEELARSEPRLVLHHDNFIQACSITDNRGKVSGILLDLGVSSAQLDRAGRGISHRINAPLDMRFGSHGQITAETVLNEYGEGELLAIIRGLGEEPFARIIARRIVEIRRASPLKTTSDLRAIILETVPPHKANDALARVFQAFRITVNNELDVLERTLRGVGSAMKPGGRIVVMSYHSLEDRIVKNVFRDLSKENNDTSEPPRLRVITPKPLTASAEEISTNLRARSAKLRVAEVIEPVSG